MKKIVFTLVATFLLLQSQGQDTYQEHVYENGTYLLGPIGPKALNTDPYIVWFAKNQQGYQVDLEPIKTVETTLKECHILVFIGTWCGDSRRELPRFLKILETIRFPMEQLKIVAVDRRKEFYKKSPYGEEWGLNILRVPSFILLKNGKELNRIVESPIESLEKDLAAILGGQPYTPNYAQ